MREGFELAYLTAYLFSNGEQPELFTISETRFINPVPPGSIIKLSSKVTFAQNSLATIRVFIQTLVKTSNQKTISKDTNEMCLVFKINPAHHLVYPRNYSDSLLYI